MSDWPVGLSTGCFRQTSIVDCLETIQAGGFNMIEICSYPAHLDVHRSSLVERGARRIEQLEIEAYSFHAPFGDDIDISSEDPAIREKAIAEILLAAEAAARFQVRYFVIHPGPEHWNIREEQDPFERLKRTADALNIVAEHCKRLAIGCVLENKLPHLLFAEPGDILLIQARMKALEVGVCLDTGHANLTGDIYGVIHKLGRHLRMVHAHDNHGNGDEHLPPGSGNIDWHRVLGELDIAGFRGGFILELAGSKDVQHLLAEARKGKRILRDISRQIALSNWLVGHRMPA